MTSEPRSCGSAVEAEWDVASPSQEIPANSTLNLFDLRVRRINGHWAGNLKRHLHLNAEDIRIVA